MAKTPASIAEKWASRLAGATNEIEEGVRALKDSPTAKAAAQADKWATRIAESKAKWSANLNAVTLQQWQTAMINLGIPRIAQGVEQAKPKFQSFMSSLLTYQSTLRGDIDKIAPTSLANNIRRMTVWVEGMAKFKWIRGQR